jgi:hypothetical protein
VKWQHVTRGSRPAPCFRALGLGIICCIRLLRLMPLSFQYELNLPQYLLDSQ